MALIAPSPALVARVEPQLLLSASSTPSGSEAAIR
jgi:hypothetical protein